MIYDKRSSKIVKVAIYSRIMDAISICGDKLKIHWRKMMVSDIYINFISESIGPIPVIK